MRLLFVVQRYSREISGGSEACCREYAERLASRGHDVHVATSCALSYADWANSMPEGTSVEADVTLHRFAVAAPRPNDIFGPLNDTIINSPVEPGRAAAEGWNRLFGPTLSGFEQWIDATAESFDVVIVFTYLYFPAFVALRACRGRVPTLFHPTAHNERYLGVALMDDVFAWANAYGFLVEEEAALVQRRFGFTRPSLVCGIGVDLDVAGDAAAFRAEFDLGERSYLRYAGRIDPDKGINELLAGYRRYRELGGMNDLVFVGDHVDDSVDLEGATVTGFVSSEMILRAPLLNTTGVDSADYSSLKLISYGASPITDKVLINAMHTFKCGFLQVYGLTETTGAVTYLPPVDHDPNGPRQFLLRAAGRPGAGIAIRIVDAVTGKTCADGEVGEVWIQTLQNMVGYWRNPKATSQAFPEGRDSMGGWFCSGDAGYLREGYLFIHDRIKDMIISGGENIYPAEVENMLMQHPAIADCAVIGVPDERWGEAVKACVVLRKGANVSGDDIISFSRERMAHFKCPKSVDFLEVLPRNPSGKLLKYVMRKPFWEGRDRQVN